MRILSRKYGLKDSNTSLQTSYSENNGRKLPGTFGDNNKIFESQQAQAPGVVGQPGQDQSGDTG